MNNVITEKDLEEQTTILNKTLKRSLRVGEDGHLFVYNGYDQFALYEQDGFSTRIVLAMCSAEKLLLKIKALLENALGR